MNFFNKPEDEAEDEAPFKHLTNWLWNWKNHKTQRLQVLKANVGDYFTALNFLYIHLRWEKIKEVLLSTAWEVLGCRKKPWDTNYIQDVSDQRRPWREKGRQRNPEVASKHKEINCAVKKWMKADRKNWTEGQCQTIENGMIRGDMLEYKPPPVYLLLLLSQTLLT